MDAQTSLISSQALDAPPRHFGSGVVSLAAFTAVGLVVAVALRGVGIVPQSGPVTYLGRGRIVTVGGRSLDLAKPVFMKGELCPGETSIAADSQPDLKGCMPADSQMPTSVVAIATRGDQPPAFEVDAGTAEGVMQGWVGFNNLRN